LPTILSREAPLLCVGCGRPKNSSSGTSSETERSNSWTQRAKYFENCWRQRLCSKGH